MQADRKCKRNAIELNLFQASDVAVVNASFAELRRIRSVQRSIHVRGINSTRTQNSYFLHSRIVSRSLLATGQLSMTRIRRQNLAETVRR